MVYGVKTHGTANLKHRSRTLLWSWYWKIVNNFKQEHATMMVDRS